IPLLLLIIFTCVANLVIIVCIRTHRPLQKQNNHFVISLAVADALVGLLVMSGMLVYTSYGLWPLSDSLCTVWIVSDYCSCTVSMIHLCLIAHDRYLALAKPLKYRHSHRRRTICINIGVTWVVGICVWMPSIIWFKLNQEPIANDCYFIPDKMYTLIQAIFVYFVPLVLMLVFYVKCLIGLRVQFHKIAATLDNVPAARLPDDDNTLSVIDTPSTMPDSLATVTTLTTTVDSNVQSQGRIRLQKKARRRHEHMRSIRTLGIIIVIFLFCWMPFCLFWPVVAYCPDCIPLKWYEYSYWSAYLNSAINPMLYFLSNKDFRTAFKKLV
ncbi:hypothetical protein CAPTEDRAFT_63914, partial [Capitella teleta]